MQNFGKRQIHSANSTGQGIVFPACQALRQRDKQKQTCTLDDRPDQWMSGWTCPNCCDLSTLSQVTIVGMNFVCRNGPDHRHRGGNHRLRFCPVKNVIIDGSVVSMGASSRLRLRFRRQTKVLLRSSRLAISRIPATTGVVLPISNLTVAQEP